MPHSQDGIIKRSSTSEIEIIKQKRAALQKLIKLTGTLNRLHQGLKSVILMGGTVSQLPKNVISKFKTLSEGLKSKSTDTLQNTLLSTDLKIKRDIKHVLEISQKSDALLEQHLGTTGNKLIDVLKEDYHEYVNGFKKKSQTSITLRIAIENRKTAVKPFNLPVPEAFIKQQITSLNQKEKKCRDVITKDMSTLQTEVIALMKREDCPEQLKATLLEIQSELKINSEHLKSGKAIDEMPIIYESIELSGESKVVKEVEAIIEEAKDPPDNNKTESAEPHIKKTSLVKHFWIWLNSPWKKKWKDIK